MMICPSCRSEFRDGFTTCVDCGTVLVVGNPSAPPPSESGTPEDVVPVFETGNASLVPLAKSLLDSAGIEYATRGEGIQDVFGFGRFPSGMGLIAGPVTFEVKQSDAADAAALLADLGSDAGSLEESDAEDDGEDEADRDDEARGHEREPPSDDGRG